MSRTQHLQLLAIDFKPWIPQDFFGRRPSFRQLLKQSFDKMLSLRADMVRNMQLLPLANKSTPSAQISAGGPEYSLLLTISGAMYDGVPQKILTFLS